MMRIKYSITIYSLLVVMISVIGCKKELDLNANIYYDIKEFLKSKNCKTDCWSQAPCEGEYARIKGKYYYDYSFCDSIDCPNFRISDSRKINYSFKYNLSVSVDSSISIEVYEFLKDKDGQEIKVRGIIEGHDEPGNLNCERGFILLLNDINDIGI